jgi:hypothetical protein
MKAAKVGPDGSVKLPKSIARRFSDAGELAVWTTGDTIILKRVHPPAAWEIAERAPGRPMPMREIVAEVRTVRSERRRRRV